MIEVPQAAIELAKRFEGFHRVPKSDPSKAGASEIACLAQVNSFGLNHDFMRVSSGSDSNLAGG